MSKKFVWKASDISISQCVTCKHKSTAGTTCTAFPLGIPQSILLNDFDHTQEYPGDNGIRYEKRKEQ